MRAYGGKTITLSAKAAHNRKKERKKRGTVSIKLTYVKTAIHSIQGLRRFHFDEVYPSGNVLDYYSHNRAAEIDKFQ